MSGRRLLIGALLAAAAVVLGAASAAAPALAIGAVVGLGVAIGAQRAGVVAVAAFAAASYFEVVGSSTFSVVKGAGALLIVVAIVSVLTGRRRDRVTVPAWSAHPVIVLLLVAFVAWAIASMAWAVDLSQVRSLGQRLVTTALVFLAVGVLLHRARDLRVVAWTMLWAGAASTVTGQLLGADVAGRATGTFGDPNEYAAALVASAAFGIVAVQQARSAVARATGLVLVITCLAGVLGSGSRGGMLALAVAIVVLVAMSPARERVRLVAVSIAGIGIGLAWLSATPFGAQVLDRFDEGDSSGRTDLWRVAVYQFQDEPVHGVGLGNYPVLSYRYLREDVDNLLLFVREPRVAHSTPLEMLSELGLVGFTLYYGFVAGCVAALVGAVRRAGRMDDPDGIALRALGRGLVASVFALLATTAFLSGQYVELLWLLLATCLAYASMVEANAARLQAAATAERARVLDVTLADEPVPDEDGAGGAQGVGTVRDAAQEPAVAR